MEREREREERKWRDEQMERVGRWIDEQMENGRKGGKEDQRKGVKMKKKEGTFKNDAMFNFTEVSEMIRYKTEKNKTS